MVFGSFPYRRLAAGLALLLALGAAAPHSAHAEDEEPQKLQWSPRFTRFTTTQYMLTLGLGAGAFAANTMLPSRSEPMWKSGILFDGATRGLLAADTDRGRRTAGKISDYLLYGLVAYPLVVDGLLVAGLGHKSADVAFQMSMINLQAFAITNLVTGLTKSLFGRARPDVGRCVEGTEPACAASTESFLSGHSSNAFTAAGLICAHHQNLSLYGDGPAGMATCGIALGTATAVGTLRIVADRHHLTDVLAGAAIGLTAGYLLPNILNYDFGLTRALSRANARVYPILGETLGIGYTQSW